MTDMYPRPARPAYDCVTISAGGRVRENDVMPIALDQSVLMTVRTAIREYRQRCTGEPHWLILGDDERFRLEIELRHHMTLADGAIGELKELYGVRVAFHAAPSLLEVI